MSKRRPPIRTGRGLFAPVLVLLAAATLFIVSWQSHRSAELRSQYNYLVREKQYQQDRLLELETLWQQATSRREIVPRAIEELRMAERIVEPKEIIALRNPSQGNSSADSFGERIRAGFDRYGQIGAAHAGAGEGEAERRQ